MKTNIITALILVVVLQGFCSYSFKRENERLSVMMSGCGPKVCILGDVEKGQYLRVSISKIESVGIESVSFHDITGDGIPEVWLMTEGSEADRMARVYLISEWNMELFAVTAGHSLFYAGNGYAVRQCAHMGDAYWYKLSWDGKELISEKIFEEHTEDEYTIPVEKPFVEVRPEELSPHDLLKWME